MRPMLQWKSDFIYKHLIEDLTKGNLKLQRYKTIDLQQILKDPKYIVHLPSGKSYNPSLTKEGIDDKHYFIQLAASPYSYHSSKEMLVLKLTIVFRFLHEKEFSYTYYILSRKINS
jgi:hypothetical protein